MPARVSRRRTLRACLTILVALPAAGALYQSCNVRRESARFPAPGQLIRVDGDRKLHLVCLGAGEPTVIFEPSSFSNALSFSEARRLLSEHTRVCSYDRVGSGWSDPGPSPLSAGWLADDLERLTRQAGLRPPFVLVPSSVGGLAAELFARRYPSKIAGLVFVDAGNSFVLGRIAPRVTRVQTETVCLARAAAWLGLVRLADPFGLRKDRSEAGARSMSRLYRVEPMTTLCSLARGVDTTMAEFAAAPPLAADVPLTVLVHEKPDGLAPPGIEFPIGPEEWLGLQQKFAGQSRRGRWRVVRGSDHLIAASQPQAVAEAVLAMVAEIRGQADVRRK